MLQGIFLALVVLFGAACKVDFQVAIEARPNGSGTVEVTATLDEEARARTPNLATQLRVEDLKATGWTVTGPTKSADKTVVQATKAFRTPAEATRVLDEVSGVDGPMSGLTLTRERKPLWWAWTFKGDLDLTGGIERFGDDALRDQLEGTSFGAGAREVQQSVGLQLALDLPGKVDTKGAQATDGRVVWTADLDKRRPLQASSRDWAVGRESAAVVAALATVGLVALLLVFRRSRKASGSHSRLRRLGPR